MSLSMGSSLCLRLLLTSSLKTGNFGNFGSRRNVPQRFVPVINCVSWSTQEFQNSLQMTALTLYYIPVLQSDYRSNPISSIQLSFLEPSISWQISNSLTAANELSERHDLHDLSLTPTNGKGRIAVLYCSSLQEGLQPCLTSVLMEKPSTLSLGGFSLWVLSLAEGFVLALQKYLFSQVQIRPFPRGCLVESKVTEVIESFPDDLNSMHPSMETKLFGKLASARLRLSRS